MSNGNAIFQRRIRQAIKASTIEVQDEAQMNHRFTSRTGQLERSIDVKFNENSGIVYIDSQSAPHGPFVHQGTMAHEIFPKNKNALRWVAQGGSAFHFAKRVHHPGTKSDPFLYKALKSKRDTIRNIFARYTRTALKEVIDNEHSKEYSYTIRFK
ncbi:hypothetical protein [Veillonella montpellierensis]|uniref:hypothetical protein n=1 Tax=Veillonella montpellierensis TaxID=187328 RepID=UPI0023F9D2F7|nr:hypothetical protein [Veillonella montpellierensis]